MEMPNQGKKSHCNEKSWILSHLWGQWWNAEEGCGTLWSRFGCSERFLWTVCLLQKWNLYTELLQHQENKPCNASNWIRVRKWQKLLDLEELVGTWMGWERLHEAFTSPKKCLWHFHRSCFSYCVIEWLIISLIFWKNQKKWFLFVFVIVNFCNNNIN